MITLTFNRIAKFQYKKNYYEMFKTATEKIAFLRINNDGKYEYPTYDEFVELSKLFISNDKSFIKFTPFIKQNINGKLAYIMITSSLVLASLNGCANKDNINTITFDEAYQDIEIEKDDPTLENLEKELDNEIIVKEVKPIENSNTDILNSIIDNPTDLTLLENEDFSDGIDNITNYDYVNDSVNKRIYLFNDKYFDELFKTQEVTLEAVYNTIDENQNINDDYKKFIKEYVTTMNNYYGNLDLRIFNENMKTINFDFEDQATIYENYDGSMAIYDASANYILISNNVDLNNLTPYMRLVLYHELGHVFNNININYNDYTFTFYFNYNNHGKYLKEGLNVKFTTDPFIQEYGDEWGDNLGYPITADSINIITDAINYDFNNFTRENIYGFEKEVNDHSNSNLDFNYIEDILELQWIDYNSSDFVLDQTYYDDLYTYETELYLDNVINNDSNLDEIKENYINTLSKGVYDTNFIDTNAINNVFENYKTYTK